MTNEEMMVYAKRQIEKCEEMIEFSKSHDVDKILLRVNEEMLDYHKSVLPLIEVEEELGIKLVILSKALKNGVYYDAGNKTILYHKAEGEEYIDINIIYQYLTLMYIGPYGDCFYCKMHLAFKDYGKTWALTKEELQ